jgi:hypothetical protein
LNALVTMMLGQWILAQVEKRELMMREPWMLLLACIIFILPTYFIVEYGTVGLLYALMGYMVRSGQMKTPAGVAVAVLATVSFLAMQALIFAFTPIQLLMVVIATMATTVMLSRFVHRPIHVSGAIVQRIIPHLVWLSRHSLHYYVVHRVVLQAAGMLTGALKPVWRLF